MKHYFFYFFLIIFLICFHFVLSNQEDPYNVLGLRRTAPLSEIKRAYKQLAKKWHPDKNQNPEAERKFVQINQAYEILSDPKRKERYDRFGDTNENEGGGGRHDFHFHPFGDFFGNFHSRPSFFAKHRIGLRNYETTILEKSYSTPYLIFVYSDFCMMCMRAEGIWEHVVNELEPLGYGIATVNSMRDGALVDKLRVSYEPSIVALVEGHPILYRGRVIEPKALKDFARQAIPNHYVTALNDVNFRRWMDENWRQRNKISVIMCGPQDHPRLRFLLAAMRYQMYASFGYVPLKSLTITSEFRSKYGVSTSSRSVGGLETFMIFNERVDSPLVTIQAKEIPTDSILSALEANKFLILPRLSSQQHLDELCPPSSILSSMRKQLCIILLVRAKHSDSDAVHLAGYREFAEQSSLRFASFGTVRYVYLYEDRQRDFVTSLMAVSKGDNDEIADHRHIVVMWRTDREEARLLWLRDIWSGHPDLVNKSAEALLSNIDSILQRKDASLLEKVALNQLVDEYSPVWYKYLFSKCTAAWEAFVYYATKEELIPMISVVGTLIVMLMLGYCVNYINEPRKSARTQKQSQSTDQNNAFYGSSTEHNTYGDIRKLDIGSYSEMVKDSPPGVRTIVILVSRDMKDVMLKRFAQYLLPWKGHNALSIGYLVVEDYLYWFKRLIKCTDDESLLPVSSKNQMDVVGTVLSINGYRRYFNIYYPMTERMSKRQRHSRTVGASNDQFLAFDSSSSDEEDLAKERLGVLRLLDGLPSWLERLFEGCCSKYSVANWPAIER